MMSGNTLSIRNNVFVLDMLQQAFFMFLSNIKPNVKSKTISTYCSDAFFILDKLPDKWVPYLLFNSVHSDETLKSELQQFIRKDITTARSCPDKDARSYTRNFWYLIEFLRMLCVIENARMTRRITG